VIRDILLAAGRVEVRAVEGIRSGLRPVVRLRDRGRRLAQEPHGLVGERAAGPAAARADEQPTGPGAPQRPAGVLDAPGAPLC
jgi:hypothetical protein